MKARFKKVKIGRQDSGKLKHIDFFMLGFGSMVGVGWAVSSNSWMAQSGGAIIAFIGFIIGTLLLLPIGMAYGELMSTLPVKGGVMAYTYAAFGSFASFISSWFVALAYLTILPWEAIYINRILSKIFPILSQGKILYEIAGAPIHLNTIIAGIFFALMLFIINFKGSKNASKLQTFLSWTIIGIGGLVIILSFIKGNTSNLMPVYKNIGQGNHSNWWAGLLTMIVQVPFFMAGFDTIAQSVGEAKKDIKFKEIAKVLILSIVAAGVFYGLVIISTGSVKPWFNYATQSAPAMGPLLEGVYDGFLGRTIGLLVLVGTLAGLFTTWNGMFMASARLLQSMGNAGLLPRFFLKEHEKYGTPVNASIFCLIAAAIGPFLGMKFINPLTNLGSVAFVLGWFMTCLSALAMRKKAKCLVRGVNIPGGKYTLILAAIISAFIVLATFIPGQAAFMGYFGLALFFVWLLLGLIFYYLTNHGDKGMDEEIRSLNILGTKSNDFCTDDNMPNLDSISSSEY